MGVGRRLLVLVLAAAAVTVAGGCETVEFGGATGVSVDATGAPVAVLAICEGRIDGLELYSGEGENTSTHGDWQRHTPASGFATVELAHPAYDEKSDRDRDVTTSVGEFRDEAC